MHFSETDMFVIAKAMMVSDESPLNGKITDRLTRGREAIRKSGRASGSTIAMGRELVQHIATLIKDNTDDDSIKLMNKLNIQLVEKHKADPVIDGVDLIPSKQLPLMSNVELEAYRIKLGKIYRDNLSNPTAYDEHESTMITLHHIELTYEIKIRLGQRRVRSS